RLALSDHHAQGRGYQGRGRCAEGRRDRLGRYMDAFDTVETPELRLQIYGVRRNAEGSGAAGALFWRDAGQQARLCPNGRTRSRVLRQVPPGPSRNLSQADQVLEDAAAGLRRRPQRLHELHSVATQVARNQGMTATSANGGARNSSARRLSAALWRRPGITAGLLVTPPLAWFIFIYLAALAALFLSAFWSVNSFTGEVEHVWTLDNFREL